MNINLAPVDEEYLKSKVDEGFYVNMAEAIRDAIRRMRETDERNPNLALYTAIMRGEQQIKNGQFEEYTPQLREQIRRGARLKAEKGLSPKPEIMPDAV